MQERKILCIDEVTRSSLQWLKGIYESNGLDNKTKHSRLGIDEGKIQIANLWN